MNWNKKIVDFVNSAEYKNLDAYYSQSSIFSALGVSRSENTHSNFLAWLLTPKPIKNDHGLGDMPLRKLLETLGLVGGLPHAAGKLTPNIVNAFITGDYALSGITVEREKHIGVGRLDIYLEGDISLEGREYPFRLAIENKVKSSEHDSQTRSYQEALRSAVLRPGVYLSVFLTPLDQHTYESLSEPRCESKEFIELNYQYLADYVICPCRDSASEGSIKSYLNEYLLALGLPELRQDKGDIIMAISKEERKLLSRFWDKHKELLIAAMLSIVDSDDIDDSERDIVKNATKTLRSVAERDLTRYSWVYQERHGVNLPKARLVLEVVANYAAVRGPLTLDELKEKFPDKLQGGTFGVVAPLSSADASNFKGHRRYFTNEPIKLLDGPVAVCTQWRVDNIAAFISCAENLGYTISSTK